MSDLIDRQAAIATAISGRVRTLPTTEDGESWIRVNEVRDSLLSLPTAQPTAEPVRHGMFIGTEYDGYADGNPVYYEWKCSECGCIFEEDEPMYRYRYCPYCGARMDADALTKYDQKAIDEEIERAWEYAETD